MDQSILSLIILGIAMVLFFTEMFAVQFTSMAILISFILTGILTPQEAFAGFTDSSILLFTAMFIVGEALFVTGVADRIGQMIIKYAKTERKAILLVMVISGLASAFLSNTGTTAIFIPIIIGISRYDGFSKSKLMMPLCMAATIGGSITLLGTPPNIVVNSALADFGYESLGIFGFSPIGLPLFISSVIYYVFLGNKFLPSEDAVKMSENELDNYEKEMDHHLIPSWKRIMAVVVLAFTVLGMVFSDQLGIPFYVIAWVGALILVFTKVISSEQAINSMDWSTVLLITGTLSIGTALSKTGAGQLIADTVLSVIGTNELVVIGGIMFICIVLSNFMSNTATAALMAPIALTIAQNIGINPQMMVLAIAMGVSASYATPFGSTPNTMVYALGGYKFGSYTKTGLPLIIINFVLSLLLFSIFY